MSYAGLRFQNDFGDFRRPILLLLFFIRALNKKESIYPLVEKQEDVE
jgi:hypothetical protein